MFLRWLCVLVASTAACSFDRLSLPEETVRDDLDPDSPGGPSEGAGTGNTIPTVSLNGGAARVFTLRGAVPVDINADANDADGDELTYAWTVEAPCSADTTSPSGSTLVVDTTGLGANANCSVSVSVSDGIGDASASVQITVVDRLTSVRPDDPNCVSDASTPGAGTFDSPWCSIAAGIEVASATAQPLVRVYEGRIDEPSFRVPAGVEVRGGYAESPAGAAWVQTSTTDLRYSAEFSGSIDVAGTLAFFDLNMTSDCTSCTMVTARDGSLLSNVLVSAAFLTATDFVGIAIAGGGTVQLDSVSVNTPTSSATAIGVLADGSNDPLTLIYRGGSIAMGSASISRVGVSTRAMDDVQISGVQVSSNGASPLSFGFRDGVTDALGGCAGPRIVCDGSTGYTLENPTVVLKDTNDAAYGLFFAGTSGFSLNGNPTSTIDVHGERMAVGIRLFGVTNATLNGGATDLEPGMLVSTLGAPGGTPSLDDDAQAIGIYDGDHADPLVEQSFAVNISGFTVRSRVEVPAIVNVTGVFFAGTQRGSLVNTLVEIGTALLVLDDVESAIGIRTYAVNGTETEPFLIDSNRVQGAVGTGRNVQHLGAAFLDGLIGPPFSGYLTLSNNELLLGEWGGGAPIPSVGCVLLLGTTLSRVESNTFSCLARQGIMRALWLIAARNITVNDNRFFDFAAEQGDVVHHGVVDGLKAGVPTPDPDGSVVLAPNGSNPDLRILRNHFLDYTRSSTVTFGGSRAIISENLRSDPITIEGNIIEVGASMSVAITLDSGARIIHNTILGVDSAATASELDATAVEVDIEPSGSTVPITFVGNAIGARAGISQDFTAFRLFVNSDTGDAETTWETWIERFDSNVLLNPEGAEVRFRDQSGGQSDVMSFITDANRFGEIQVCPSFAPAGGSLMIDYVLEGLRTDGEDFYGVGMFGDAHDAGSVERPEIADCP
ncbi:MAG: hypothetical protein AAF654_03030 [Myxococcota bacterium]